MSDPDLKYQVCCGESSDFFLGGNIVKKTGFPLLLKAVLSYLVPSSPGFSKGFPWGSYGISKIYLGEFKAISMGYLWGSCFLCVFPHLPGEGC